MRRARLARGRGRARSAQAFSLQLSPLHARARAHKRMRRAVPRRALSPRSSPRTRATRLVARPVVRVRVAAVERAGADQHDASQRGVVHRLPLAPGARPARVRRVLRADGWSGGAESASARAGVSWRGKGSASRDAVADEHAIATPRPRFLTSPKRWLSDRGSPPCPCPCPWSSWPCSPWPPPPWPPWPCAPAAAAAAGAWDAKYRLAVLDTDEAPARARYDSDILPLLRVVVERVSTKQILALRRAPLPSPRNGDVTSSPRRHGLKRRATGRR